jgi:hypothetical protein
MVLSDYFLNFSERVLVKLIKRNVDVVTLYGAGELGIETYALLRRHGIQIQLWVDIKANKNPLYLFDKQILPTTTLAKCGDSTLIIICSEVAVKPMYAECLKQGVKIENIITLDAK